MGGKFFAVLSLAVLLGSAACGCGNQETTADVTEQSLSVLPEADDGQENTISESYIFFGNVEADVFAEKLEQAEIEENTLIVGVDTDYSIEAVEQLNELLAEQGYEFQVLFCRIPERYLSDGAILDLAECLRERGTCIDILPFWGRDLSAAAQNGFLADISGYLGRESTLRTAIPDIFWELTAVDDRNYGVGMMYAPPGGWAVNVELMGKYGFTEEDLAQNIWDLENVFRTVSEGEKNEDFAAFVYEPRILLDSLPISYADASLPIGYWYGGSEDGGYVVNLFETETMEKLVGILNQYYEKGYVRIGGDAAGQEEFFMQPDYNDFPICRGDSLDTWTNSTGIELVRIPYFRQETDKLLIKVNAIPSWSNHLEDAWKFLDFVYQNEEASTLLLYGTAEDYSVSENGYVAGESLTESCLYSRSLGNKDITRPLLPYEDSGKTDLSADALHNLQDSPLYGFSFDAENVAEEAEAVRELYNDMGIFRTMFAFEEDTSFKTWQEFYEAYKQELKNAGIDRIVDEMNRQIQEYLDNEN